MAVEAHHSRPADRPAALRKVADLVVVCRSHLAAVVLGCRIHLEVVRTVLDLEEVVHTVPGLEGAVHIHPAGEVHHNLAGEDRRSRLGGDRHRSLQDRFAVGGADLLAHLGCRTMSQWHREAA